MPDRSRNSSVFASAPGLILLGFLFVAGALLFTEHWAHAVLGGFIWVLLLAVLILPAFTHGGWRSGVHHESNGRNLATAADELIGSE